jgi:hypothetical protein
MRQSLLLNPFNPNPGPAQIVNRRATRSTIFAARHMAAECRRAAALDGRHHLQVAILRPALEPGKFRHSLFPLPNGGDVSPPFKRDMVTPRRVWPVIDSSSGGSRTRRSMVCSHLWTLGASMSCEPFCSRRRDASVFQAALKAQFATAVFGDGTSALTVTPRRRLYAAPSALSSFSFGGT